MPIAGHAEIEGETLRITGLIAEVDGSRILKQTLQGSIHDPGAVGTALAERLLALGGREILAKLYA